MFKEIKNNSAFIQFPGNANFYYATNCDFGLHVIINNKNYLFTSFMDYELAKEYFKGKIIPVKKKKEVFEWLKKKGIEEIFLPQEVSYIKAKEIEKMGFKVNFIQNPFIEKRKIKSAKEIKAIKECCEITIKTFKLALKIIRKNAKCSEIKKRLENYLYSHGYVCNDLIVSSGKYSAIPHATGKGNVENHVVIDIFPMSRKTKYHADFTRTVVIERNQEIEDMIKACVQAKNIAISIIKEGVKANEIFHKICEILEENGYKTIRKNAKEGFIHAAGHGVGLEIHEAPSLSEDSQEVLKAGMILTVEPGLYYKKIGGVRVEDTVLVRKNKAEILTKYPDIIKKRCRS
ncbi:MAG TPA: aminopeptidase P family protein [Nanoarchaeota archaeon]|nr:aminopeptidase P family protein [Nanoarchaeota archaeon]